MGRVAAAGGVSRPPANPGRPVSSRGPGFSLAGVWAAFLAVHAWLAFVNLADPQLAFGDVTVVYRFWVEQGLAGTWPAIDGPWVYPLPAILPMLLSAAIDPAWSGAGWLAIVTVLDSAALAYLLSRGGRHARSAAWWWTVFLALLGPIALVRIDAVAMAIAVAGMVAARQYPRSAGVLLTLGAWMKVWPGVLVGALAVVSPRRWRVLVAAVATSVAVVVVALALGSGWNVFSFLTVQSERGLQVEAPVSVPWLWAAALAGDSIVYFDREILTYQLAAPGVDAAASAMTPLLVVAVLAVFALGVWTMRRAEAGEVLPVLALALVAALLVTGKVGSPQLVTWLAAPVVLGIATLGSRFVVPAVLSAMTAALTQAIYPFWYDLLLALDPALLVLLTVRNALFFVLLGWALVRLVRLRSRSDGSPLRISGGDLTVEG